MKGTHFPSSCFLSILNLGCIPKNRQLLLFLKCNVLLKHQAKKNKHTFKEINQIHVILLISKHKCGKYLIFKKRSNETKI